MSYLNYLNQDAAFLDNVPIVLAPSIPTPDLIWLPIDLDLVSDHMQYSLVQAPPCFSM